ncbi:1,2-dihydroxy-3-keto-5-methylthiopentene dioxygenase [Nitrosococcus watsonii]|uniref:Acireductone dioxygenase n=1 Tax=Nitrosococcus watsoni (strain C-113) TaxID=105559 RepID=D8KBP0_NITWC|nr:cupin domain-containing protein [Nitrosococcus watsonii]ADJ27651.1 Acireductone dioxygenase ARD [Nitrosococcus watsonii C-113]
MSILKIYHENDPSEAQIYKEFDEITQFMEGIGVCFQRWEAQKPLSSEAPQEEILSAYRTPVDQLCQEYGFKSVDIISVKPDHPEKQALREKFLSEHTHSDFEVRFFVEGKGQFYLHAQGKVYALLCEQGDFLSVPAGLPHWFDMGENPNLTCIRLFTTPEGWVANFTGNDIADHFPRLTQ